jgi:hypothetical protein
MKNQFSFESFVITILVVVAIVWVSWIVLRKGKMVNPPVETPTASEPTPFQAPVYACNPQKEKCD